MADTTTIRRIPRPEEVAGPVSLRPTGSNPAIDVSGPYDGAQALAAGVDRAAQGVAAIGGDLTKRQNVADTAAADASWLRSSNAIADQFNKDNDFTTFEKRSGDLSAKARDAAASLISDDQLRSQWLGETEKKRIGLIEAVKGRGVELQDDAARDTLSSSIDDLAKVYADPTTVQVTRDQAQAQIKGSIDAAVGNGLITPGQAQKLRRIGLEQADQALAFNRASVRIQFGTPDVVQSTLNGLGVSTSDVGGQSIVTAASAANGGKLPDLDPGLAKVTADLLGDANFPTDPAQQKAYLTNPDTAARYAQAASAMLSDRYDGDLTAVAVALDPQGGTVMADKWVKSKHNEDALPKAVRDRVRATMTAYRPAGTAARIAVQAYPGLDLDNVDPAVLDRFETLQSQFGEAVPLIPSDGEHGDKSVPLDGRAIDLDVSKLSDERRAQLLSMASAMGFTGIGVYKNSIHLDTGPLRSWGEGGGTAVPAYAKDVLAQHDAGTVGPIPLAGGPVSKEYAALDFDQRLQLAGQAKQALKQKNIELQSSIETIAQNAPAAIANTGKYDGDLPSATAFVQAYGSASEGIAKYREFKASLDTAKTMFGFRAESSEDIMAQVAAAAPTSSGNDADLEDRKFKAISDAAANIIKQRAEDPAGYVLNTFPPIAQAFTDAQNSKDPAAMQKALQQMAVAQDIIGIDSPELLPKPMATAAAQRFNDAGLPAQDRIAAIAGLIGATTDEGQQFSIYKQLIKAGVPDYTQGAVSAMLRGDVGAAQNLMRAVMVDPAKLAGQLPSNIKTSDIDSQVQSRIFDTNMIGDIVYGITDGSTDNFERVRADSTLINRDVQLHLVDGSAGGDLNKAIDLTIKDLYGDVQPVTGGGVKITLPTGVDPQPYRQGFEALQPTVREALSKDMENGMVHVFGKDVDPVTAGLTDVIRFGVDNAVDQVMRNGYFISAGNDQYQFLNPYTGAVVTDANGQAMTFDKGEVLASGAANPLNPGLPPTNPNVTPDRLKRIYGPGFGRPLSFNPNG